MHINIIQLIVLLIFTMLAWWAVHQFTLPSIVVRILEVLIVVVAVVGLLSAVGVGPGLTIG